MGSIDEQVAACRARSAARSTRRGFDTLDRKFLRTIIEKFDGGPVGIESIAAAIGEERGTLEDVIEPFLIQQGFVARTARGPHGDPRLAWQHFGLKVPERAAANLQLFERGQVESRSCWQARVYWEDTDAGGIVYYANYLRFLERARTEWLRGARRVAARAGADPGIIFYGRGLEARVSTARRGSTTCCSISASRRARAAPAIAPSAQRGLSRRAALRTGSCLLVTATVRVACLDARRPETAAPAGSHSRRACGGA